MAGQTLYAIEEELFVTEPRYPSLQSLYYLARLLWQNPKYYWTHSASNFARGEDVRQGLMSGIEISTRPYACIDQLLTDLVQRRMELAAVCQGLLVPVGHLFDYDAPTNTCGLHIHIGPVPDLDRVYSNLAYFLPLLACLTVNSPFARGSYVGASYRMARSYAIGPLREDRLYRFQDMIVSKRLGTIEIRVFDPVWDIERLGLVLRCIDAIVTAKGRWSRSLESYAALRQITAYHGYEERLQPLFNELAQLLDLEETWFVHSPAKQVAELQRLYGTVGAYSAIDNAYRNGVLRPRDPIAEQEKFQKASRAVVGLAAYYMVKLPYMLKKVWTEW